MNLQHVGAGGGSPPADLAPSLEGASELAEVGLKALSPEPKTPTQAHGGVDGTGAFRSAEDVTRAIDQMEGRASESRLPQGMARTDMARARTLAERIEEKIREVQKPASTAAEIATKQDFNKAEGSAVLELFREDPDRFAEFMQGLKPHQRQTVTMRLQDEMQSQNQLFSLISNLQQSDHQTSKGIIANIRA